MDLIGTKKEFKAQDIEELITIWDKMSDKGWNVHTPISVGSSFFGSYYYFIAIYKG
jgi:hypothetical protein